MNDYKEEYITIRYNLMEQLQTMIEVYLTGTWDPLIKHCIIKELQRLIIKSLSYKFPDFPIQYLPHIKINFDDDIHFVGASIQEYLNTDTSLIFLGNTEYDVVSDETIKYIPRIAITEIAKKIAEENIISEDEEKN